MLDTAHIAGFKSIRDAEVSLGQLNVLVGANGAGKSNFVAAFDFLGQLVDGRLQLAVRQAGGASRLLHASPKSTRSIGFHLSFGANEYEARLGSAQGDDLFFESEWCSYQGPDYEEPFEIPLGEAHTETRLGFEASEYPGGIAEWVLRTMREWRVYHFHDTSQSAPVKQKGPVGDDATLRPDAGNLAAFLYRLQSSHRTHYRRIVDTIRLVNPFFDDFDLKPDRVNPHVIQLEWRQRDSDAYFDAHSMSDGTLRFACLATLLLQPDPPSVVLVDEPELGLHPFAIVQLADMLRAAAQRTQLIIATQSVTLLDQLDLEDLIILEQRDGASTFERPDPDRLAAWLEEYAPGELWQKNVLGGRPRQAT